MNTKLLNITGLWILFLSLTGADLKAEISAIDAKRFLEGQWGGEVDLLRTQIEFAPSGHTIVSAPSRDAKIIKEIVTPGSVNVSARITNTQGTYYISDWSWNRFLKQNVRPNWVIIPKGQPVSARNSEVFWSQTYDHLRHDEKKWNCHSAYQYFMKNRNDRVVIGLLSSKYATERDPQARACAISILCASTAFSHDVRFFQAVAKELEGPDLAPVPNRVWYFNPGSSDLERFIVRNGVKYQKEIARYLESNKMYLKWLATHTLYRHNLINNYRTGLDDRFFSTVLSNLRGDGTRYNAVYATRTLLMVRPVSDRYVQDRLRQRLDDQERFILQLFERDLLQKENRDAFNLSIGDLCSGSFHSGESGDVFQYELGLFMVNGSSING